MEIESLATAATIAAGLAVAFRLGIWLCDRRADALLAVVRSFCVEVAVYHRLNADGEITDEEAREFAAVVGRFVADLEALGELVCRRSPAMTLAVWIAARVLVPRRRAEAEFVCGGEPRGQIREGAGRARRGGRRRAGLSSTGEAPSGFPPVSPVVISRSQSFVMPAWSGPEAIGRAWLLPSCERREDRDHIPVFERRLQAGQEMNVPSVFKNVHEVPERPRRGEQQCVEPVEPRREIGEQGPHGCLLRKLQDELRNPSPRGRSQTT